MEYKFGCVVCQLVSGQPPSFVAVEALFLLVCMYDGAIVLATGHSLQAVSVNTENIVFFASCFSSEDCGCLLVCAFD